MADTIRGWLVFVIPAADVSVFEGQPQRQKQRLTQIRGAGSDGEQPHISFGPVHSVSLVHSLWHVHCGSPPGPPQPQR